MASSAQPSHSKFSAYGVRANPSSSFASADDQGDRAEDTTIAMVRSVCANKLDIPMAEAEGSARSSGVRGTEGVAA